MKSIQITGNKAQFQNYLTDPLQIKANSAICLNKASLSIPVWTQKFIKLPLLDAAERANTMLNVRLNGVDVPITWTEFYNAYDAINDIEAVAEAAFYNGNHTFYLNNRLEFLDNNSLEVETIPSFSETLAKACSDKFAFYIFNANNNVELGKVIDIVGGDIMTINGNEYTVNPTELNTKNFGLVANYSPEKVSAINPTTMDQYWSGADFTRLGDNITLTGAASSYAIAKDTLGNSWAIDPNGGFWNFRVDLNDDPGSVVCGIILTSQESKPDTTSPTTITADSIQVGIKFSKDGARHFFQAVDGSEAVVNGGVVEYDEVLYPRDKVFTYDNDTDEWFIQIRRAAGYETGSGKFVVRLFHGDINNQGFDNAECFYSSEFTIPGSDIFAVPIIFSEHTGGGAGTNEIKDNFIIDILPQSRDMSLESNVYSDNSFQLVPNTEGGVNITTFSFFNAVGLHQNEYDSRYKTSYDTSTLSNSISWSPGVVSKKYFIGVNKLNRIFDDNINHLRLSTNGSSELPRQIEISLLNLSHTPYAASFAQEVLFTEPDINKVVSYLLTDPQYFDVDANIYLEYVYEAFNLVYRDLNNAHQFPLNNFQVKIGYKDFLTNLEKNISEVRGVVKIEFLIEN